MISSIEISLLMRNRFYRLDFKDPFLNLSLMDYFLADMEKNRLTVTARFIAQKNAPLQRQ
ncbi:hypothetical protein QU24_14510 [Pantoea rodasii]|uniref:Uncharacterized protein n=1 Tax=Pantoea rodasii TaxID=1076549 RepID=A0A0B1R863_9GAMM|nr:hypothetical protein QU24_14510 [Pantoea rodasii]